MLSERLWPSTLLLGEGLFATASYLANRSLHSAFASQIPCFKLHGKQTDMTALRTTEARVFVYVETHTPKLKDRAWEGCFVGYSPNSKACSIYTEFTQGVVDSHNVIYYRLVSEHIGHESQNNLSGLKQSPRNGKKTFHGDNKFLTNATASDICVYTYRNGEYVVILIL